MFRFSYSAEFLHFQSQLMTWVDIFLLKIHLSNIKKKTIFKLPYYLANFFQVDHLLFCNHVKDRKCFCLHFPNEGVNDSILPWRGGGVPVLLPVDTNCRGWTMGWNFLLKFMFSWKATKIGKSFTFDLMLSSKREDFVNFRVLLRKYEH